ncbi:PREDICTED: nudix hydrolase 17, mitochondrial-like [Ipomoea nil]|uniref:nudix hydrolase 17, mitochondrial-like n=1 Tax=Ipomoea nil TaxID=35883 RepID=UPI0009012159|nr:PREDICTED: nudix hydrolase 17, mitochondrial-like [Ipomoea nil]
MQIERMVSMSSRTGRDLQRYNVQGCRQVVGCIPYRYKKDYHSPSVHDLEFLLVSSQKSPRLMFPKGGWEQDESLEEAASRETFEEAGVLGEAESCLGTWYFKSKSIDAFHEGFMLPLFVTEELDDWPERDVRLRLWVSYEEAMERCFHPWMKEALDVFVSQLTLRQEGEKHQGNAMETEETLAIEEQIIVESLSRGVQTSEEEMVTSEEPRIDNIVSHQSMQNKEDKSLGTVYCIEVVATEEQKVEERPWNALLMIEITIGFVERKNCETLLVDGVIQEEPRMGIIIA